MGLFDSLFSVLQVKDQDLNRVQYNIKKSFIDLERALALWDADDGADGGTLSVATYGELGLAPSSLYRAGKLAFVASSLAIFLLMPTAAALRTNVRIAARGKSGYQWVRVPMRNPVHEVKSAWFIDTAAGSDDAVGTDAAHPLLTHTELSLRLANAEIAQTTTVTYTGDQQAGDAPTFTYASRGQAFFKYVGTPTVLYSSTVTGYSAMAYGGSVAVVADNQFTDAAVPGGSFTAAGALAKGVLLKRTSGTVIYASVLADLGGTTARIGQPVNPASVSSNAPFVVGDSYQLIRLPSILSLTLPAGGTNFVAQISLCDWKVPVGPQPGVWLITSYLEALIKGGGQNCLFQGCCFDSGGGSLETNAPVSWSFQQCSFKGTGATLYALSGIANSESTMTSFQGAVFLVENGIWNAGQMAFFDCTSPCFTTGTGGRGHFVSNVSGKGNASKMLRANQASQIVTTLTATDGNFWNSGSTSDPAPIQCGTGSGNVAVPLDPNMNGIFQTT